MNDIQHATGNWDTAIRWIARLSSLAINSVFLRILILALTNDDKPQGAALPVLVLLALTIGICFAAWRWERAGGIAVLIGAICLGVAAYTSSRTKGVGPHFLIPLVYAVPFALVGILFLLAARQEGGQRFHHRGVPVVPLVHVQQWPLGPRMPRYAEPMQRANDQVRAALRDLTR